MALSVALRLVAAAGDYLVVVSETTAADGEWRHVVAALEKKYGADVVRHQGPVESLLPFNRSLPRFVCFVARPEEVTREFVMRVNRLMRRLDDDPWPDAFYGILTGYDAANARRIAEQQEPLTVRRVAAGTEVSLAHCEEGVWFCELKAGRIVRQAKDGNSLESQGPADSTAGLVQTLNEYRPDLFVTSGHATERDWMIGFTYRNGYFRHQAGKLYGEDTQGRRLPIESPNPKIYLPVGNCLMGHIDQPDCMATSWMNGAGVHQMIGYTVPTWYGYAGWGMLDYFVEQPGRFTLAEAFLANQLALLQRLQTYFPELLTAEVDDAGNARGPVRVTETARAAGLRAQDGRGLLFDRDVVAFYGDPAWVARMASRPASLAWEQFYEATPEGLHTLEIRPRRGRDSFRPPNTNGSQRGGRPFVQFLPQRVGPATVLEGAEWQPVIADNFILVPNPGVCEPDRTYRVRFRAEVLPETGGASRRPSRPEVFRPEAVGREFNNRESP
ncbi:MAG: hypothetical protein IPM17_08180 [Verrucomicrobia bacterium]|nr:hypothetical protein [Verrucomicrobiota bacterium]